jgi:hypothetical protein
MDHTDVIADCYGRWFHAVMDGDTGPFETLLADDSLDVDISVRSVTKLATSPCSETSRLAGSQ